MQIKYTHHVLFKDTDVIYTNFFKTVVRSSKLDARVMMGLNLKNIVLSEKSQKQVRFRAEYHFCKSNTQCHHHHTSLRIQIHLS